MSRRRRQRSEAPEPPSAESFVEKKLDEIIKLDEGEEEEESEDQAVLGLRADLSDNEESDSDDSDDEDLLAQLPEHLRRHAMAADLSDEDGEDSAAEEGGKGRLAADWGKKKHAYYNADTADLEIGQEFEEAEEEEAAAIEEQREGYQGMTAADFGLGIGGEEEEAVSKTPVKGKKGKAKGKGKTVASGKLRSRKEEVGRMRDDLEAIMLGGQGKGDVTVMKVAEELTAEEGKKLSKKEKLSRLLSHAPELPLILEGLQADVKELTERVIPLTNEVTEDVGASADGLLYLRTKKEALLGNCLAACYYLLVKAQGKSVVGHEIVGELLRWREVADRLKVFDEQLKGQMDLLCAAIDQGVQLQVGDEGEQSDEDEGEQSGEEQEEADAGEAEKSANWRMDEEELEYMGMDEEVEEEEKESKEARKRRRRSRMALERAYGDDEAAAAAKGSRGNQGQPLAASGRARAVAPKGRDAEALGVDSSGRNRRPAPSSSPLHSGGSDSGDPLGGELGDEWEQDEDDAYLEAVSQKARAKKAKKAAQYAAKEHIGGALEEELEVERLRRAKARGLPAPKRAASYTIIKNRGLTPHKNKLNRNPRAKKREAYRKAVVRRKGQVRDIRTGEEGRYGGEATGIKAGVVRSRKFG
ncbi:unnamed protein product [Chrysoparadoxa australica]